MSKALSLKLNDNIFSEVEKITREINVPRNTYINMAVDYFNKLNKRKNLKKQLLKESKLVSENSMEILEEFEKFEELY